VVVAVAVRQQPPLRRDFRRLGEELLQQRDQRGPAHQEAATQQNATDTQRAQALDLAVPAGEALRGRLERPAHGREGEDVADEVRQAVDRVGEECCRLSACSRGSRARGIHVLTLTIEHVAAKALAHGHAQVHVEPDARDADAGVALVPRQQERVVMVVVVSRMCRRHGEGIGRAADAVAGRGEVDGQRRRRGGVRGFGAQDADLGLSRGLS
jgi:hypothetical protein